MQRAYYRSRFPVLHLCCCQALMAKVVLVKPEMMMMDAVAEVAVWA